MSIENRTLVPQEELDKLAVLNTNLQGTNATIVTLADNILTLHKNIKQSSGSIKDMAQLNQGLAEWSKEWNNTITKQNSLYREREQIAKKVVASESEQVKSIQEVNKELKENSALEKEKVRLQKEADKWSAKIAMASSDEAKAVEDLKEKYKELASAKKDNINASSGENDTISYFNEGIASDEAIRESNEAFEEWAETIGNVINKQEAFSDSTEKVTTKTRELSQIEVSAQQAFDSLGEKIQMQSQNLIELQLDLKNVQEEKKELDKRYEAGLVTQDSYILKAAELNALERDLATSIKSTSDQIKYSTQVATTQIGSYKNVEAQYSLLRIEIDKLGEAEGQNIEVKRELEAQSEKLYQTMIKLKGAQGQSQLQVGKYDLAVTDLSKTVSLIDPKLGMIVRKIQNVGVVKKTWIGWNNKLITSLGITARAATFLQLALVGMVVGGIYVAYKWISNLIAKQKEAREVNENFTKSLISEQAQLSIMFSRLEMATKGTKEYDKAKQAIQDKYGDVLKNQREEIANIEDEIEARKVLVDYIFKTAQAKALEESYTKAIEKYSDKTKKFFTQIQDGIIAFYGENKNAANKAINEFTELINSSNGQYTEAIEDFVNRHGVAVEQSGMNAHTMTLTFKYQTEQILSYYTTFVDALDDARTRFSAVTGDASDSNPLENSLIRKLQDERKKVEETWREDSTEAIKKKNEEIARIDAEIKKLQGLGIESKKVTDSRIKDANRLAEANSKASQELSELEIKIVADTNKQVLTDTKASFDDRLDALRKYIKAQEGLLAQDAQNQIDNLISSYMRENKGTTEIDAREALNTQIELITLKMQTGLTAISKEESDLRVKISEDEAVRIINALTDELSEAERKIYKFESTLLKELSEQYRKGEIKSEEYAKSRLNIEQNTQASIFNAELDLFDKILENQLLTDEDRAEYTKKRADKQEEYEKFLNEVAVKENEEAGDKIIEQEKKLLEKRKELLQELANFATTLMDAVTQRQLRELDKRLENYQNSYDEIIRKTEMLEEAGAITTEQANARKAEAEQKLRDKEKEIEAERQEAEKKQFFAQQAMAATQVIISTALGVANALAMPFGTGIPLIPWIKAIGAIQLATILAQTAAYKDGTDYHHGGLAWVGDGYRSEAVDINGSIFKTPAVPTLVDLPKGAKVYPDFDKYMDMLTPRPLTWGRNEPATYNDSNVLMGLERNTQIVSQSINKFMRKYSVESHERKMKSLYNSIINNNSKTN